MSNEFDFVFQIRQASLLQPDVSAFAKDFLIQGLHQTLVEFRCGPFETSRHIDWYWQESKHWKAASYPEFVTVARRKLKERLRYTERSHESLTVVAKLYDKAQFAQIEYDEVLDAITFLAPTQEMPNGVIENQNYVIIDVTLRESSPRVLKVDADFLPTLKALYPWRREDDKIMKDIPTAPRPLDLNMLAFWQQFPDCTSQEIEEARTFRNGDRLDWTRGNLRSRWRDARERRGQGVDPEPRETVLSDGSVRPWGQRNHVLLTESTLGEPSTDD